MLGESCLFIHIKASERVTTSKEKSIFSGTATLTPDETRTWLAAIIDSSDDAKISDVTASR